jgi:hypothetical protein
LEHISEPRGVLSVCVPHRTDGVAEPAHAGWMNSLTPHKPHHPQHDVPEEPEPTSMPVEPDEGPVPAAIPDDPESERQVSPVP